MPADTDDESADPDSAENTDHANNADNTDDTSADDKQNSQPTGPSEAPGGSSEPVENNSGTTDLSNLYIGAWIAEGQSEGDEQNGWTALYLNSATGNSVTFSLEKIQSAPASRMASTYPITVTLESGKGTFPVSDSWGNSGTGEITVKDGVIYVKVSITNPDPMSMWDISMDTDFYPEVAPVGSAGTTAPMTGFGTTEEEITQEFKNQSYQHGASFSVSDMMFLIGADGKTATFQFDFGEASATFNYYVDRSYGEISVGNVSNRLKLTEVANAAFLILSGNDNSTSFKSLPSTVFGTEPTETESYYSEDAAVKQGSSYVETVMDAYTGVYTADDYECTFWLSHCYDAMQVGRLNDRYSGNIKFSKIGE